MAAARVYQLPATPKGLSHAFGVHAVLSGVPLPLVQRWLGHSDLSVTAIYTNVLGQEEQEIARRMW
jgi:integrase/recombinase XerD